MKAFMMTLAQTRRRAKIDALTSRLRKLREQRQEIKAQMLAAHDERERLIADETRERAA